MLRSLKAAKAREKLIIERLKRALVVLQDAIDALKITHVDISIEEPEHKRSDKRRANVVQFKPYKGRTR